MAKRVRREAKVQRAGERVQKARAKASVLRIAELQPAIHESILFTTTEHTQFEVSGDQCLG